MRDLPCNPKGCERVAGGRIPVYREKTTGTEWSRCAPWKGARHPCENLAPLPGCCFYFHAFRWSTLRYDHRLLSISPSGCTFHV